MKKISIFNIYYGYKNLKFNYTLKKYPEIDNIFGEKNHALTFIQCDFSNDYHKKNNSEYNKYCKPINVFYDDFILGLHNLINSLIENPTKDEIMYIFGYLYYNGYLSIDNNFKFMVPEHELIAKKSFSIFTGEGVCRNIADMFIDLLNIFEIKSFGIITDHDTYASEPVFLSQKYEDLVTRDEEEFNIYYENEIKDKVINTGSHFEVITMDNKWQIYDPTSLCAYDISKKENEYPCLNTLKLWSLYSMGTHTIKQTTQIHNIFKTKYLHLHKGSKYLDMQEKCYDICEKNKKKIKQFHERYYEHINILNESMKELKRQTI